MNVMRGIKYALSFIWGFILGICVLIFIFVSGNEVWIVIPILFIAASIVALVILVITFLMGHWSEK